ncbi:MAG: ATP-binding protein, partial [Chitinivibrionia bacterium]|nr:ATP-binding protein [Chitinivibrionia bacterium]
RLAFLDGTTTIDDVRGHKTKEFEAFLVDDYPEAYELLRSGAIDAFFDESPAEAAFDVYGKVYVNTYFPIIYSPVSLTTQNPELRVIINVVQKALQHGAIRHLTRLYNRGHRDYLQHKLFAILTDEEREFIRNNPVIPFVAEHANYPISFMDSHTGKWEGIAFDAINEIERLTGLSFKKINDQHTEWTQLLEMVESGEAAMITELIPTEERAGRFLWAGEKFFRSHSVLISKVEFRDIYINEILYVRTGVAKNTAHSAFFRRWFPNHPAVFKFENTSAVFDALERGEIDVVMTGEHQLLTMTNYRENIGYKANFVFDFYYYSTFGFNKDQAVLNSIITKAMYLIEIEKIAGRWLHKTYDYRIRLMRERIPFMIAFALLSLGLIFALFLFVRKRNEGQKLETLVSMRTQELQKANRIKTEFLANMSHEIRTPMNAIIGMSEILEHEALDHHQMGYVKDISMSAQSLLGIINDILDMSKIEAEKFELQPIDYNFILFIDNIVSMFTHISRNKGLEFIYETSGEIPEFLLGDDLRLRQVLLNLCSNAVKFTQEGSVKFSVIVKDEKIMLKVEDSGAGIRKEDIPKLFNAFEQVDKTNNRGIVGTGLGLPICKSFVEMMGGEIMVESEYGHGTAFTVSIPIVIGNPENIRKNEASGLKYTLSAPTAKILVVDDNEFNLRVASGYLNFMQITAQTADSGFTAIDLVKENDYDIVFMDHMMPEMDGIETVKRIREMGKKYEDLKIIALTANAISGAREMFLSNKFNDFISKPIDAYDLQNIVQKYLPPEKVSISDENPKSAMDKDEQFRRKNIATFVKDNKDTFDKISKALSSGDVKTAHRIAHTLKSSAGYLGKKELQSAAAALETSLQSEPFEYTSAQVEAIKTGLERAFKEFEPILKELQAEKSQTTEISAEKLKTLLAELKPLLENSDFSAGNYTEKLQKISGMEKLAEKIDEYDFDGALTAMKEIVEKISDKNG